MGILYISEYAELAIGPAGRVGQMPMEPPLAEQAITFTTVQPSAAFNAQTRFVRLHTDTVCFILFGTAPVAVTATNGRMAANQTEYHAVPQTGTYKVSVVA